jgi:hypothetical protein
MEIEVLDILVKLYITRFTIFINCQFSRQCEELSEVFGGAVGEIFSTSGVGISLKAP